MKIKKHDIIGFFFSLLITVIILRGILSSNSLINYGDLSFPFSKETYPIFTTWDTYIQSKVILNHRIFQPWILFFNGIISQNISLFILTFLLSYIPFWCTKELLNDIFYSDNNVIILSSIISSIWYTFNPLVVVRYRHYYLLWFYAFLPLLFLVSYRYFSKIFSYERYNYGEYKVAIILSIMSSSIRLPFFFPIILFPILANIKKPYNAYIKTSTYYLIKILVIYIFLNSYWILPFLYESLSYKIPFPTVYVVTKQVLELLSRNSNFINVITINDFWATNQFIDLYTFENILYVLWKNIIFLMPLISISSIIFYKKKGVIISLSSLLIIVIILALGINGPIPNFYEWLVFNSPISFLGWQFRGPNKWSLLTMFCYCILGSFTSFWIISKINMEKNNFKKLCKLFIILLILILPSYSGYPLLSGTITYNTNVVEYVNPDENFIEIHQQVKDEAYKYQVLVYPKKPPFGVPGRSVKNTQFYNYMLDLIQNKNIDCIPNILSQLNIKYIYLYEYATIFNYLNMTYKNNYYLLSSPCEQLYIPKECILVNNPHTITSIYNIKKYSSYNTVYFNTYILINPILWTNLLELDTNAELLISYLDNNIKLIKPFDNTYDYIPQYCWSKTSTSDPLHGPWSSILKQNNIESFDFDYNQGLVFTSAASRLYENSAPTNNDIAVEWLFNTDNDIEQWQQHTPRTQFGVTHILSLDGDALKIELYDSTWGWKTITSPPINVDYSNWYRLELRVRGENIQSAHIKVLEYNEAGQNINGKTLQSIGTGNIDWTTINIDYTPEKPETKYIQLQIWHGHQTTQPLPNIMWIDHLKVYDLQRFVESVTLEIPYTIPKTARYILLARVFQNQQGGRILVKNDQENYPINTRDQLNKFTWIQLDNTTLQKGQHKITLTNLEGFNAVNLFALVPAQEYRDAQTQLTEILQDKRIIHILEAETDIYRENTATTNKYGSEASNGQTLELSSDSKTWREIETAKPGNYTIAINAKGPLNIKMDEEVYKTYTDQLDWTYIGPIHLETGTHRIEITSPSSQSLQWDFEDGELNQWTANSPNTQTLALTRKSLEEGTILQVELTSSTSGWKTVTSPLIPVTPGAKYIWSLQVAGENTHKAHIKIVEYDENKKPLTGQRMKGIGDGNFTWTRMSFDYTPTLNATYIALQIWHGHETTQPLPNKLWLDDIQVTGYQPSDLDVVWLYSINKEKETLEDIFKADETPAEILEYIKIDPTKYTAKINATKPFMLSFAESYDPLWVAKVNGQKTNSIPLYSVINGFWIEETGIIDITIEYEPQRWFYMGSAISITTLIACAIYLTHDWTKNKAILKRVKKWSRSKSS